MGCLGKLLFYLTFLMLRLDYYCFMSGKLPVPYEVRIENLDGFE